MSLETGLETPVGDRMSILTGKGLSVCVGEPAVHVDVEIRVIRMTLLRRCPCVGKTAKDIGKKE